MLRNSTIFIFFIVGTLLFASCNKWFDVAPKDGIIKENYWKTKEQLHSAVIGCYGSLLDNTLVKNLFLWGELRADNVAAGLGVSTDEQNILNGDILANNSITSWSTLYSTINNCNIVLQNASSVKANDPSLTDSALAAYEGEARALRSLMYFYLTKTFGDVPLKVTATSTDDDIASVPKSTQNEILDFISSDLLEAEGNVTDDYGVNASNKGRITKYAVDALLADVYLWKEKYDSALIYANKIIYSGKYELVYGDASWFYNVYYLGNSAESIFEFQFDEQKLNPFYSMFATSTRQLQAGETILDEVFGIDYENEDSVDIRGSGASVRSSDNAIWKYTGVNSSQARSSSTFYAHWVPYRYAEILLIKAEALAELGFGSQALVLIRRLRERAHALDITEESPGYTDREGILTYILNERRRELAYEGKRWYDVLRFAKRDNYERISLLYELATRTAPGNKIQSLINKYKDHNSHYLPINSDELLIDKNLVQNPFYE